MYVDLLGPKRVRRFGAGDDYLGGEAGSLEKWIQSRAKQRLPPCQLAEVDLWFAEDHSQLQRVLCTATRPYNKYFCVPRFFCRSGGS